MKDEKARLLEQNWEAKLNLAIFIIPNPNPNPIYSCVVRRRTAVIGVFITCIEEMLLRYKLILSVFLLLSWFLFFVPINLFIKEWNEYCKCMVDWKRVQPQYWKRQTADVFPHLCFSLPPVVPQARAKAFILHLNKQTREQQRLKMTQC